MLIENESIERTENSSFLTQRIYDTDAKDDDRRPYAHDRDRIIHSKAFRRMMHKTQIFNANKGDHFRNRLTHTLEVTQIAQSLGRALGLNEDLVEAIALGHDLGHTPFGHVGERTLNSILMNGIGDDVPAIGQGFKHNFQSVRVVDSIENRCDEYNGLNLTLAVKEGILKHTKLTAKNEDNGNQEIVVYTPNDLNTTLMRMNLNHSYTLEGQVVAVSDEIAQLTHDIEDGIRGGIISFSDFTKTPLVKKYFPDISDAISYNKRNQIIKGLVGFLIEDVKAESIKEIENYHKAHGFPAFQDINSIYEERCIWFSKDTAMAAKDLAKKRDNWIIFSKEISQSDSKAEYMIKQIFKAYYKHPKELPDYILTRYYKGCNADCFDRSVIREELLKSDPFFIRLICDHISGMSDQFSAREYLNLYMPEYY